MRVKIAHDDFAKGVAAAARVAGGSSLLASLSGILVEADGETVTLKSTNLELQAVVTIAGSTEEPGKALVPAKLLTDVAKNLPGTTVMLWVEDEKVQIEAGDAHFDIEPLPVEDFPKLVEVPDGKAINLSVADFQRVAAQTLPAVSTDDTRPILTGLHLVAGDRSLTAQGTDSYRMARRVMKIKTPTKAEALIPRRAITEANGLVKGHDSVSLQIHDGHATLTVEGYQLTTRLIEGKFPDVDQLIPAGFERAITASRKALVETVTRIAVVAPDSVVTLTVTDGKLHVTSSAPEIGRGEEPLDVQIEGDAEGFAIAFNPRYLLAGLKAVNTDQVVVEIRDELKPVLIKPVEAVVDDPDDTPDPIEDYLYLLMPVRV